MTDRIDRLRAAVGALDADAVIVTHAANRRYLSGFPAADHAPDESAGVLVVTEREATLLTSPTNHPWAKSAARADIDAAPWERPWSTFVANLLQKQNVRRVAFEDRAVTVADFRALQEAAPELDLVPAGDAIHALRAVKDADELVSIARAAAITDAAFERATSGLQPGITERELAWQIELAMRQLGAQGPAFPIIVAAGPHGARPHHDSADRPIAAGEPIVIDMGAAVDGYAADLTRTIVIGEPTSSYRDRYNSVLEAQRAALSGIRPGMSGQQADALARDALTAAGMGDQFIHGLGHGVGLLIHEAPSLGKSSEDVLLPGHVVTVEPGVYFEGWGGIRIEDLCLVTDTGVEILSTAPK